MGLNIGDDIDDDIDDNIDDNIDDSFFILSESCLNNVFIMC